MSALGSFLAVQADPSSTAASERNAVIIGAGFRAPWSTRTLSPIAVVRLAENHRV
jgi:hypothetical protein